MTSVTTLSIRTTWLIAFAALLFFGSGLQAQTRPNFGTASTYAVFTGGGAINNTGLTRLTGDVGQDGAYSFNGFPPGIYSGTLNRNNGASALAKADLLSAWTTEAAVPCGTVLGVGIVDGQSFDPGVYCSGAASTTTGNITFNAHGNANAIFIVKIGGQLDANGGTHILLANNARAANIYWFVDGAVNIADHSSFKGTIFARGAITFSGTSSLDGRALVAPAGSITLAANNMAISSDSGAVNNLTVTRPAFGDTVKSGMLNDTITWIGSGIAPVKTLQYSLDSGLTWTTIATITNDSLQYLWHVPATTSTKAFVRVTDTNNLRGVSGRFVINSSKAPAAIAVMHPMRGDTVVAGTQNYQITWTGSGLTQQKSFEFSLDSGLTWKTIGTMSSDLSTYSWNVLDTVSALAMIRITDSNGVTGTSGIFTISRKQALGSIVVVHPAAGEIIAGGMQNYQITFTAANTTSPKRLEYSLDGGANWNLIGFLNSEALSYSWANVPNVATTRALVRITDANGVTGTSGLFTITNTTGVGSMNSLTVTGLDNQNNIGNNRMLGINWTFTPDIGASVEIEYSLDNMVSWNHIATIPVSESPNSTTWMTTPSGSYNPVFIRATSTKGMTLTSTPFSIGSSASVTTNASASGYSVSNYPNPASSKTTINAILPIASDVTLRIFDELGRSVRTLTQHMDAGSNNIPINTSDLVAGTYTYTLETGTTTITGHMSIVQ